MANDTRTVAQLCSDLVDSHFQDNPFDEPYELGTFTAPEQGLGLLSRFQKFPISKDPFHSEKAVPSLLLHGLENGNRTQPMVYEFIDSTRDICSGLYGTSGAGKTRTIFEYLSQNFGLYFVASTENDPGSRDLSHLISSFSANHRSLDQIESDLDEDYSHLNERQKQGKKEKKEKAHNDLNQGGMNRYVQLMIYVRTAVFTAINKQLEEKKKALLTPYDWLLIQLFPKQAMKKKDLFTRVFFECLQTLKQMPDDQSFHIIKQKDIKLDDEDTEWPWSVMVVDEAQVLLHKLNNFFLSQCGRKRRTAFSGVLKGMSFALDVNGSATGYPLVAGTGMSIDDIKEASLSIVAKRPHDNRETIFTAFSALDETAVQRYLLDFLKLDLNETVSEGKVSNASVIEHISKWLRGRPRWTATFLELYLVREYRGDHVGTRGSFSTEGGKLMQALDRYLEAYTSDKIDNIPKEDRKKSFDPPKGTAFSAIKKVIEEGGRELSNILESAIFKYVVGGNPSFISEEYKKLIEAGVAALSVTGNNQAVLDEPIMIEAGIKYFSLEKAVLDNMKAQEPGGHGEGFEKVMLPAIQRRFPEILQQQLPEQDILSNYSVSGRSAYGVLALKCLTANSTIEWIDAATKAKFEGQVPPFCYPDNAIGPDVMFLLWNLSYEEYIAVISQAKYRKDFSQIEALQTITPDLLYHQNRGKETQKLSLTGDEKRRWEEAKPKLVGTKHGCVRFMVQYLSQHTTSANPGVLHDDQVKVEGLPEEENPSKRRKVGWLATVSKANAATLFASNGLAVLDAVKKGILQEAGPS